MHLGWNDDATSDVPEYEVNTEPLGRCPFGEDCEIIETPTQFVCPRRLKEEELTAAFRAAKRAAREKGEPPPEKPEKPENCGFVLPRTVCKREITRDEALVYLQTGKTELLTDFTSRFGRPFSATLVLKETGRHGFEFPPRGAGRKKEGQGEEAATAGAPAAGRRKGGGRKTTRKKAGGPRKKTTRKKTTRKKTTRKKATRGGGTRRADAARKTAGRKAPRRGDDSDRD